MILTILVVGNLLYDQYHKAKVAQDHVVAIQAARPVLGEVLLGASRKLEKDIGQTVTSGFHGGVVDLLRNMLSSRIAELTAIKSRSTFGVLPSVRDFQRLAVLNMEIDALTRAIDRAQSLEFLVKDLGDSRAQWVALGKDHSALRDKFANVELNKQKLRSDHPVASVNPLKDEYQELNKLIDENNSVRREADELKGRIENIKNLVAIKERRFDIESRNFSQGAANVEAALAFADRALEHEAERLSNSFFGSMVKEFGALFGSQVMTAGIILLSAIMVPISIKLLFFYLLAPWASRQPPIQVMELTGAAVPVAIGHQSSVSIAIEVAPDEELLVSADYIQSSSVRSNKTTRWFLDARLPFTSVAAGLVALTRVAPGKSETVVVSSGKHAEMKISLIDLPKEAAFVIQPRCIVGLRHNRANPLKVTRHWQLGNLNSWLTLQFRYLVFHGPATLIVKGCRGVRMEKAGNGRLINQSATLGFSAGSQYSVRRCETFVSYWRGADELFNDQFTGVDCVYLYEEMPSLHRKGGIAGRGLEGFTDSVLKVFGI